MSKERRGWSREQEAQIEAGIGRYATLRREAMAGIARALGEGIDPDLLGKAIDSQPDGVSRGQIYNWSEGRSPMHFAALGPLSLLAPDLVVQLCEAVLRPLGRTTVPIDGLPVQQPTIAEAVIEVSEAQAAASKSGTEAIRKILEGPMTPAKLETLEALWKEQDDEEAEARRAVRALGQVLVQIPRGRTAS